jgi:hypothetical protein
MLGLIVHARGAEVFDRDPQVVQSPLDIFAGAVFAAGTLSATELLADLMDLAFDPVELPFDSLQLLGDFAGGTLVALSLGMFHRLVQFTGVRLQLFTLPHEPMHNLFRMLGPLSLLPMPLADVVDSFLDLAGLAADVLQLLLNFPSLIVGIVGQLPQSMLQLSGMVTQLLAYLHQLLQFTFNLFPLVFFPVFATALALAFPLLTFALVVPFALALFTFPLVVPFALALFLLPVALAAGLTFTLVFFSVALAAGFPLTLALFTFIVL